MKRETPPAHSTTIKTVHVSTVPAGEKYRSGATLTTAGAREIPAALTWDTAIQAYAYARGIEEGLRLAAEGYAWARMDTPSVTDGSESPS